MNSRIIPNDNTLRYYFYFMQERMNIFWRKCQKPNDACWTDDSILKTYKFTNVYRAIDRVSQYLIKNIIYGKYAAVKEEDMLLRILVFKIFNRPDTWEYLMRELDRPLTVDTFNPHVIAQLLTKRQEEMPIFNNAYMMTGSHSNYIAWPTKHEKWLQMVELEILKSGRMVQLLNTKSIKEMYDSLLECSFVGGFLAYQYAIDLNYAPFFNYDENSFVKAGIGAIRGIKKCFIEYGDNYEDAIRYVHEHLKELQERYGYTEFNPLPGHEPKLIDLQNCFCETDKYLRAKMPELKVDNIRIKQKYNIHSVPIDYVFPPAWKVNIQIQYDPTREKSLFDI